jgi:uncharacterized protein YbbK (DUF523 family)
MSFKAIKIAVSSCLLGNPVRYDGEDKYNELIVNSLSGLFTIVAVCPEMLAGLGSPRPPVQLVKSNSGIQAVGVNDRTLVVTGQIEKAASTFPEQHPDLCGMILKSRSPSCGLGSTPLYNQQNTIIEYGNGLFADKVRLAFPGMPIKEDSWFTDQAAIDQFVELVNDYALKMTVA